MTEQPVLTDRDGAVARLTLNRPERRNALDRAMWQGLEMAIRNLSAEDSVRCVLVTGAGDSFGAGADLAEFERERWTPDQAEIYGRMMVATLDAIRECPHPTIAAIRGACMGGGLEIAVCCDLRIASASAKFGAPIQKIGVVMPWPELAMFVELIGRAATLEMLLEGRVWSADEAMAKGLVTRAVADAAFDDEISQTVARVASGAPLSHRLHKRMVQRLGDKQPLDPVEFREAYDAVSFDDYREGIRAFLEKRKPDFRGQ
ncbi:MAG: enoyl-CoA hydratase/isomerase family protein [Dongiaceae bacterium]